MEKLFYRHYAAIMQRGLINDKTQTSEFITKMQEELSEICNSTDFEINHEVMDLICVCTNFLINNYCDIKKELKKNLKKQQLRAKQN